jgi:hypothetical protein
MSNFKLETETTKRRQTRATKKKGKKKQIPHLADDSSLLQQIVVDRGANDARIHKDNLNELAESRAVVVPHSLRIPKRLQDRIASEDALG